MAHIQGGGRYSVETIPKEAQTLDLLDKDFKRAFTNMFKELRKTMSRELKKKYNNDASPYTEYQ